MSERGAFGRARELIVANYVQYIALAVGVLVLVVFVRQIGGVLLTFGMAAVLAYVLNPVVRRLEGLRLPRTLAVVGLFVLLGLLLAVASVLLIAPAVRQIQGLLANPQILVNGAAELVDRAQSLPYLGDRISDLDRQEILGRARQAAPSAQAAFGILSGFVGGILGVFGTILTLFLMMIVSIYLLIDRERVTNAALDMLPETVRGQTVEMLKVVEGRFIRFIKGQLLLCAIVGVVGWAIMQFTVGRYAAAIGIWVGLMEFIPVIGAFLGAAPAVAIALLINPVQGLIVAALFFIAQQIEGNVLVPKVIGDSVNLHPLWVLFGVMVASTLYGVIGALFVLPLLAVITAVLDYLKNTLRFEHWGKPPVYTPEAAEEPSPEPANGAVPSDGDRRKPQAPSFPGDRRGRQGEG